jgi:FAD/FMN-containing dehydrogenase
VKKLIRTLRLTRRQAMRGLVGVAATAVAGCAERRSGNPIAPKVQLQALDERIAGTVTVRHASDYEAQRYAMVWNARKPDRYPDAIVRVESVADVREAVRFARDRGLKVAVRGGGHHWSGTALRDGGLLIDLSALRDVVIDKPSKTAVVQPGMRNLELAQKLAEHDLAFPLGHCPSVTVSGYLLGGGFGWNAGEWGVACWNVTGVDVITADGQLVHASADENTDLFWAARGAGAGFFGIVVGYHLRLFDVPRAILTTTLVYPIDKSADLARWASETGAKLPPNVELVLLLSSASPAIASEHPRTCTMMATAFCQTLQEAAKALEPVADCPVAGRISASFNQDTPLSKLFESMDASFPAGKRYAVDTLWLAGNPPALLSEAARQLAEAPSRESLLLCAFSPPPPADAPPMPDCAFSMVGPVYLGCYAIWNDEPSDAANVAWLRKTTGALSDSTIGYYLGETDLAADPSRARRSFGDTNWQKLAELRRKYDAQGVFHGYLGSDSDTQRSRA